MICEGMVIETAEYTEKRFVFTKSNHFEMENVDISW